MRIFCKEFLLDLERTADRDVSVINKLECDQFIFRRDPIFDNAEEFAVTNQPLSQSLTAETTFLIQAVCLLICNTSGRVGWSQLF